MLNVIILAAGRGSRLNFTNVPKVLYPISGTPMIHHVLNAVSGFTPVNIVVVVSPTTQDAVKDYISNNFINAANNLTISYVVQEVPRGTADAVRYALPALHHGVGYTLIMCADTPLVDYEFIKTMMDGLHSDPIPQLMLAAIDLSHETEQAQSYGRMVTNAQGKVTAIVEARDATPAQLQLPLGYGGVMLIDTEWLHKLIPLVSNLNRQQEYYLTDLIKLCAEGQGVINHVIADADILQGVNDNYDLHNAESFMQARVKSMLIAQGCRFVMEEHTYVCADLEIGVNVVIEPFVHIGPKVKLGNNVTIRSFSYLTESIVHDNAVVGPFAHLRPHSELMPGSKVGNFVEVKNSKIGPHSKVNHLSYIGDTVMGSYTNVGAGTIVCNYDGVHKHTTNIGSNVFVGSNSTIIAPTTIDDGALIAAGSVITKPVAAEELAIARTPQQNKPNGATRFRRKQA